MIPIGAAAKFLERNCTSNDRPKSAEGRVCGRRYSPHRRWASVQPARRRIHLRRRLLLGILHGTTRDSRLRGLAHGIAVCGAGMRAGEDRRGHAAAHRAPGVGRRELRLAELRRGAARWPVIRQGHRVHHGGTPRSRRQGRIRGCSRDRSGGVRDLRPPI